MNILSNYAQAANLLADPVRSAPVLGTKTATLPHLVEGVNAFQELLPCKPILTEEAPGLRPQLPKAVHGKEQGQERASEHHLGALTALREVAHDCIRDWAMTFETAVQAQIIPSTSRKNWLELARLTACRVAQITVRYQCLLRSVLYLQSYSLCNSAQCTD